MEGILIPGLPNDVSVQILARIPRQYYSEAIPRVSSSWRGAVESPELFALRKRLRVTESWIYAAVTDSPFIRWFARNSTAEDSEWWPLPLMREGHRPICGFSCAVIGDLLFVIGGCEVQGYGSHWPATNKVSVFNARTNRWNCVQEMKDARAFFACGVVNEKLYVAGGHRFYCPYDSDCDGDDLTALKSAEMYNPLTDVWIPVADMIHDKHNVHASVIDGKFVVHGYFCLAEVFQAGENRWVKFDGIEENGKANDELFYPNLEVNTTIEENGKKCGLIRHAEASVVISI